ncbi:peptidase S41 [Petrotoga sp. HKA.pet.4.5]|jgi:carboxyl-terminal processing protease|uniref:S41 family peptidase n=1 Tax=unclassified Petrotoga TaxID=2620614 RepID=UPI000EF1541D|nr:MULTISPECIES: S41 family peptidase [unclassified Petrotoga]RLL84479.1 peptidase S41 [Petrotoga sp. Shatin.DS.tank11.9.2.9.3]RLL89608.1 peptidase S41 [Petrotoga sp. HKA.pet.4.5]
MSKKKKKLLSVIIIFGLFITSWIFADTVSNSYQKDSVTQIYLDKFEEPIYSTLYYIVNYYYDKDNVDYDKIVDSAIEGMMKGLDDPFAWYLDSVETEESQIDIEAKYGGVGLTIRYDYEMDAVIIVSPMNGTPAQRAGIMPNDYILSVDGTPTSELGLNKSASLMRGEPGTEVTLEIYRDSWTEPKNITLIREIIETKTVKFDTINYKNKNLGYILLTNFAKTSSQEMSEALNNLSNQNIEGLIIDLRNNPGGLLQSAVDITSMFLKSGEVVSVKYFDGTKETIPTIPGNYYSFLQNIPIVLLVNGGSASASEILTGALKDNGAATVIGETTYGKAAVQNTFSLSTGGEIWLPIAHYFTPSGADIHLKGINPDIEVSNPEREVISMTEISEEEATEAFYTTTEKPVLNIEEDLQLKTALDFLTGGN